jgi:hypothetical protein
LRSRPGSPIAITLIVTTRFVDVHDSFAELLRAMDPWAFVELLGPLVGLDLREANLIVERTPTIAVPSLGRPRKRVADIVLVVLTADRRMLAVLILEVQLSWDATKRWTWGLLAVAFAAERRCAARVLVFTPDPDLRGRMRRRLLPSIEPVPLLIEPDQIPLICDLEEARRRPRETIFAALYHVAEISEPFETRVAGIRAALIANRTLDQEEQLRYGDLMLAMTPAAIMQRALEELGELGEVDESDPDPKTLSAFFRQGYSFVTGKEEGLSEGLEQGRSEQLATLRAVLVGILTARGIMVEDSVRARIDQCLDVGTLARWCTQASSFTAGTAGSLDEQLTRA